MRALLIAVGLVLLAGCSEGPSTGASKPGEKRPVGMPDDIWKVYSGAESGVGEGEKAKDPPTEKK
jgi:hypothetical protein